MNIYSLDLLLPTCCDLSLLTLVIMVIVVKQATSDSDKQASSEQSSPKAASTPVAKPDHAASSATSKSVQNPDTSSYAPVAPAPLSQKFTRPKVGSKNEIRILIAFLPYKIVEFLTVLFC